MKIFNMLLMIFCVGGGIAQAATLAELQDMALTNRELVGKYESRVKQAQKGVGIARSGYLPSLDAAYVMNELDEGSAFEARENSIVRGALTWNLFAGFRDKYGVESARLRQVAEQYSFDGIKQDIRLNVALRYLTIFDRQASRQVAEDSYNSLLNVYRDAENRYKVGMINKNELLKIKVDLDNAEIGLKKAGAALTKSVQLLQREIDAKIGVEELAFDEFSRLPQLSEFRDCEKKMLDSRSEIKALEAVREATEAAAKAAQAANYPRLDLTSSYQKYDDALLNGTGDSGSGLTNAEEIRHQLTLSINLFDGFAKSNRIEQTRLAVNELDNDLTELRQNLRTELENLYLDYDVSKSNVEVARSSIAQAEENVRITRLSYEEGLSTLSDLLDAITSLSRARSNFVGAKSELYGNYFQISRMVGGFGD